MVGQYFSRAPTYWYRQPTGYSQKEVAICTAAWLVQERRKGELQNKSERHQTTSLSKPKPPPTVYHTAGAKVSPGRRGAGANASPGLRTAGANVVRLKKKKKEADK